MHIVLSENPEFWLWGEGKEPMPNEVVFDIGEGKGFLSSLSFDRPKSFSYDPVRCGVFADWLDDNRDRLLAQHKDSDQERASQRLENLCKWLRSGLQVGVG